MKAATANGPAYQPLYRQIKYLITESLVSGEWRPGQPIPSEIELAHRYSVSQGTVRKAVDEMAAENLLVRRQGKGTFVATKALPVDEVLRANKLRDLVTECLAKAAEFGFGTEDLERELADAGESLRLKRTRVCDAPASCFRMRARTPAHSHSLGLEELALPWLGDPTTAIWAIVFITAWQWIGFPMLLYGAALGGIPEEITEAADIDGATGFKKFRSITFPLLLPALGTVSILTFIGAMEAFPIPYAVGGSTGSPAGATDVMALLFYRTAFESGDVGSIGTSSALAMLLFLFIFGVAVALRLALSRGEKRLYG